MRIALPERIATFSESKQDLVKGAVDLYKHYLYLSNPTKHIAFAENAKGDYEEKNAKFNKLFRKQAVLGAYLPESALEDKMAFNKTSVREAAFAHISSALDVIIPQVVLEGYRGIAQTDMVGMGNTKHYEIPNNHVFKVNRVARGVRVTEHQTDYMTDITAIPEPRMITIKENFMEILLGKVDWGRLIQKIALAYEVQITTEIYTAIAATYSGLDTNLKEAGFSQTGFVSLAQRVQALNNNASVTVMGTKVALGNILPQNDYLKTMQSEEYVKFGHLGSFMGVNLMEVPQAITANTTDFALADDELYFFSLGVDKPIKIAMEDGGMTFENMNPNGTADGSYWFTTTKAWDLNVITSSKYGIMKIN